MSKRALITGITGQDGLYLAELLLSKGYEVHGIIRGQNNPKIDIVKMTVPEVILHTGDLTDMSSLIRALKASQPHEVYNLAAISFVAYSWENAALTSDVTDEFYTFEDKYLHGKSRTEIPARIPEELADLVRKLAARAFAASDGYGMARVDFFLERLTGRIFLNELNFIPGFTSISMYPKMMAASGVTE